jgi:hypothetical protein
MTEFIPSWRTTVAGIGAMLVAIGGALSATFDNDPVTVADWTAVVAACIAGFGLIFARDNKVSSEKAGVK